MNLKNSLILLTLLFVSSATFAQTPELTSWQLNTIGTQGQAYIQGNFTPASNGILANVQLIQYSNDNVYINSTGMPEYPIGPYLDGNPSTAGGQNYLFRIIRNPIENSGTKTAIGLGHIGILTNGVPVFNSQDARSYNNDGIWNQVAPVVENAGFDCSKGHPAPNMGGAMNEGYYHHHQNPNAFSQATNPSNNVCDSYPSSGLYSMNANQHSPLIGYAFDGFPIYGPFGYADTSGTGGLKLIKSSYQLRNITDRTTLPGGGALNPNQYGPSIGGQYPLGYYVEDYEFIVNSGDLDVYNGRVTVTPEYPNGIYCYYATVNDDWNSVYPFFLAEEYYGIVADDNFGIPGPGNDPTNVTINEAVTTYNPATSIFNSVEEMDFNLFPNPAKDRVKVSLESTANQAYSLKVMTLVGQLVQEFTFEAGLSEKTIELGNLKRGLYFMVLENDQERLVSRLVIAR